MMDNSTAFPVIPEPYVRFILHTEDKIARLQTMRSNAWLRLAIAELKECIRQLVGHCEFVETFCWKDEDAYGEGADTFEARAEALEKNGSPVGSRVPREMLVLVIAVLRSSAGEIRQMRPV
jgi:hypothetical protein